MGGRRRRQPCNGAAYPFAFIVGHHYDRHTRQIAHSCRSSLSDGFSADGSATGCPLYMEPSEACGIAGPEAAGGLAKGYGEGEGEGDQPTEAQMKKPSDRHIVRPAGIIAASAAAASGAAASLVTAGASGVPVRLP